MSTSAPTLSFELMPPRNEAAQESFWSATHDLISTRPDFISVTYGAGGHNRETAHGVTARLVTEAPVRPLAHLTCVGTSRAETTATIDAYLASGVRAFLALRGDPPLGSQASFEDELKSSIELIALLKEREQVRCQGSAANKLRAAVHPLIIAVATFPAGNPAAKTTRTQEIERLLVKQAADASFAITQLFYRPETYLEFVDEARQAGVHIPILGGILPPTNPKRLRRVAELTGVKADQTFLQKLENSSPEVQKELGIEAGANLIRNILNAGAPGVHLYTFNQAAPTLQILEAAGLIGNSTPSTWLPSRCDWSPQSQSISTTQIGSPPKALLKLS